jgi:heat shock protein HslJ
MRTLDLARPLLSGLFAFSLALACGEDPSRKDPLDLDERVFLLESADGFEPVADTSVRLSFQNGELSVSAGCNGQGGPYTLKAGRLLLDGLGSTALGCSAELSSQDQWLAEFLSARPAITLQGTTLTLRGERASLVFADREVADPDRPLAGAPWTIDSSIMGGAVATSGPATLEFSSDGNLVVEAVCYTGSGRYSVSGDRLTFTELAYSEKPCSTPLADRVLRAVVRNGNADFEIVANRLTIERGGQGVSGQRR